MDIIDTRDLKFLRHPARLSFYETHISLGGFLDLYKQKELPSLPTVREMILTYEDKVGDIEIWTPAGTFPNTLTNNTLVRNVMKSISSKGRIVFHSNNTVTLGSEDRDGYLCTSIGPYLSKVHRVVLSSFSQVDEGLEYNLLTGDHINYIKNDNRLTNLRWLTSVDNVIDGQKSPHGQRSKSYRLTVVEDKIGDPVGTVYNIGSRSDLRDYGISPRKFKEKVNNVKTPYPYGCKVEISDSTETFLSPNFINFFKSKFPY